MRWEWDWLPHWCRPPEQILVKGVVRGRVLVTQIWVAIAGPAAAIIPVISVVIASDAYLRGRLRAAPLLTGCSMRDTDR